MWLSVNRGVITGKSVAVYRFIEVLYRVNMLLFSNRGVITGVNLWVFFISPDLIPESYNSAANWLVAGSFHIQSNLFFKPTIFMASYLKVRTSLIVSMNLYI